jgi:hypothetical protein
MSELNCFVCHRRATTVFRAGQVEVVRIGDPDRSSRTATGPWLTCYRCATLIVQQHWDELADLAVAAALEAQPVLKSLTTDLRGEVRQLHADFAASRTGPPEPLAGFVP